jgi:hypothetical protein
MGGMPCGQRGVGPVGKVLKNSKLTGPPKLWLCSEASNYLGCGVHSGKEADLSVAAR